MRLHLSFLAAALLALVGCNQTVALSPMPTTGSSSGAGAPSTSGSSTGSASTGTSAGSSGGSSGQGTSGTTGGTTGKPPPTFVDGGFVFCSVPNTGDGGSVSWLCPQGTYLCDPSGQADSCFQCRSDADCRDQSLPTYDPLRPRCDLDSGIPGYQNYCQQCLGNADCSGNPAGSICDTNPTYPLDAIEDVPASSLEPPIETLGFETCQKLQVDCRLDGGPDCVALGEACDPVSGICSQRTETCTTDKDCVGLLTGVQIATAVGALPLPFCVNGGCSACDGGRCPNGSCASDADCAGGQSCDPGAGGCVCIQNSNCPGLFPACTGLDGGNLNDAGQPTGSCGCVTDADCGDGGLACLPGSDLGSANAGYCGVPCTAPDFTSCNALMPGSVCDSASGLCTRCGTDLQCAQDPHAGGPRCTSAELGTSGPCGCIVDSDCPTDWSCDAPDPYAAYQPLSLGVCTPAVSRCTPSSCGTGYFCNWSDGGCVNHTDLGSVPSCIDDYDCVAAGGQPEFCISGVCEGCRSDSDCRIIGKAAGSVPSATFCCQPPECPTGNGCTETCDSDADCVGNPTGAACTSNFNTTQCGCRTDQDCANVPNAPHCNLTSSYNPQTCECAANSDCPGGQTCQTEPTGHATCTNTCTTDSDCASGLFCHPTGTCLPRCDMGHTCKPSNPACDVDNVQGDNDGGVIWCYPCLTGNDCPGELACDEVFFDPPFCASCPGGFPDCGDGVCVFSDGLCHPTCKAGLCPAGQLCDTLDLVGNGADLCYECLTAADCPNGDGCDRLTHVCGTCEGPTAGGALSDCPPDAVCSNYWGGPNGICLQNCDRVPCPVDRPLCETFPSLTPDHAYCFGCLSDSDCTDAGPGSICDTSISLTFSCLPP